MMEILSKITISEVILLFNLLFVLPTLALLLLRLRKYEALYGVLPTEPGKKRGKKTKKIEAPGDDAAAKNAGRAEAAAGYAYRTRTFMSPAERNCLRVMREVLGDDVDIFPKVALWETVDPMDAGAGASSRLEGKDYDFLICDRRTGQPLTAVMFKGGRGRPAGSVDELVKICESAGAGVVFIEMADDYNVKKMKEALRIPELELD